MEDDDYFDDFEDDGELDDDECGLTPDGFCMLAGTEYCDWDCGRLNADRIAAMKEQSETDKS